MKKLIILVAMLLNFPLFAVNTGTGTTPQGPTTMGQPTYPNSGLSVSKDKVINLKTPSTNPDQQRQEENGSMQGLFGRDGNYIYWDPKEKEKKDYE